MNTIYPSLWHTNHFDINSACEAATALKLALLEAKPGKGDDLGAFLESK
jgi:hypothetical protein